MGRIGWWPGESGVPDPARPKANGGRAWGWWPMWIVTVLSLGAYLALSLGRWRRQAAPSWDLAIFEQAIKGYAYFKAPIIDIKGPGFNQLGDHFSPLLAVLGPVYWIAPSPITLLVAQCLLIAVSIVPVMMTARRFLGDGAGVLLGIAYGVSWGFQSGIDVQFHEYALAVPLLAFGLWALLAHRWVLASVLTLLLLGVKEDLGFTVIVIGTLMFAQGIRRWNQATKRVGSHAGLLEDQSGEVAADSGRQALVGAVTTAIGFLGTLLILFVLIPSFNPAGSWDYWGRLTGNGSDISGATGAGTALGNLPNLLTTLLTPAQKVNTLVLLAALVLGSCVVSPLALVAVPTLLWRFISPNDGYWGSGWHYSMILMPIIFMAAVDALRKLRQSRVRHVRTYARVVPALACAFGLLTCLVFPFKDIARASSYAPPPRAAEAAAVLELIAPSASVATDTGLITQLVTHHTVYWMGPLSGGVVPDYVLLDPQAGWSSDPGDPAQLAEAYYPGTSFTTIYGESDSGDPNGYRLAKREG